jgi:hypothetical protein
MALKERFKGLHAIRLQRNPHEQKFAETWQEQCEDGRQLEYMLSPRPNERHPVSKRDQEVANTVIQWLGTPVGQCFLEEVLAKKGGEEFLHRIAANPKLAKKMERLLR